MMGAEKVLSAFWNLLLCFFFTCLSIRLHSYYYFVIYVAPVCIELSKVQYLLYNQHYKDHQKPQKKEMGYKSKI